MSKPGSQHAYRLVCPSRIQRFQCVIGLGEQTAAVVSRLCRDAGVEVRAEYRNGKIGFVIDSDSFGGALVVGLMEILGEKPEFDEKKCKQCKTHPVVSPFRVVCSQTCSDIWFSPATVYDRRRPHERSTGNPVGRPKTLPE